MARTGWGKAGYTITSGVNDTTKVISKDRWNLPLNKGAGILGFDAQTETSATTITPNRSVLVLNGSTEVTKFLIADSEEYDILYVFQGASASASLTNTTGTPTADGEIVGLGGASTITLSETTPKIFIRKSNGTYQLWVEYGGSGTAAANELTGTTLASNVVTTSATTVGALDAGSITSGFGSINIGSSTITTTGAVATGAITAGGTITGDLTGDVTGDVTGDLTGNADTATSATTATTATNATNVALTNEATDTTCFPLFADAATGNQDAKTNASLTFNSNTANLATTTFTGALVGNASTATSATTAAGLSSTLATTSGGTNLTSYATGDIIYASGSNTLAKLAVGSNTHVLTLTGGVPVWAAGGGGAHTEQEWDVYDPASFTPTPAVANTEAYMYTEKIDTDNDGLFIQMWKNGASQAVQIA